MAAKKTTYTPMSKIATVTDADDSVVATTYDMLDRTNVVTDPVGRQTRFTYDARGQTLIEYRAWQTPLQQQYATYTYGSDGEKLSRERCQHQYDNVLI